MLMCILPCHQNLYLMSILLSVFDEWITLCSENSQGLIKTKQRTTVWTELQIKDENQSLA